MIGRGPRADFDLADLIGMGGASDAEGARIRQLFASPELSVVQFRERADNLVPPGLPPGGTFDLVLATRDRGALHSNSVQVGVTYLPDGPVVARIQAITAGETRVFRAVPYKAGAEIAVVFSDATPAAVSVAPAGTGAAAAALPEPDDPVGGAARKIGPWVLGAVAIVALVGLLKR
jgi:hypothetical protein